MSTERRGRPRSEETRLAILRAARDLLIEGGYDGLTIAGVARRAGSGVQTIYRWWPDKAAIVAECVLENLVVIDLITAQDTGDTVRDLRTWIRNSYDSLNGPSSTALFRALVVATTKDEKIAKRMNEQFFDPLRAALAQILSQGILTGQVRRDISAGASADLLVGAMILAILTRREYSETRPDEIADVVLGGLLER